MDGGARRVLGDREHNRHAPRRGFASRGKYRELLVSIQGAGFAKRAANDDRIHLTRDLELDVCGDASVIHLLVWGHLRCDGRHDAGKVAFFHGAPVAWISRCDGLASVARGTELSSVNVAGFSPSWIRVNGGLGDDTLLHRAGVAGVTTVCAHTLPTESASTTVLRRTGFALVGEVTEAGQAVWRWERPPPGRGEAPG